MGGVGSGIWYRWRVKDTTENQYQLDIRWLKKQWRLWPDTSGTLSWSCNDGHSATIGYKMEKDRMILYYNYRADGGGLEPVEQAISFDRTPCNYGGFRTWFFCPKCWRRVAVLYGVGKYFLCRHCYNLTYTSQQENKAYRLLRKARKVRRKLGASEVLNDPIFDKPKNMHRKTFQRLRKEAHQANSLFWKIMEQRFCKNPNLRGSNIA